MVNQGAIRDLAALGQSIWYDFIDQPFIATGELARLIREDGLAGLTSNPAIFQKAIGGSGAYDGRIRALVATGTPTAAMLDTLVQEDIRAACDAFRPLYDATRGLDGRVSIEVSPALARDTAGTVREGLRLQAAVDRPNAMIKVPATVEGLPAVTALIAAGVDVNVTLIFSVERYGQVMDAWLAGLEQRAAAGGDLAGIRSVASFFISRIDTAVEKLLAPRIAAGEKDLELLRWRAGIANSRRAWGAFRERAASPRFRALAARGANIQRILWASTGTKDPALSPTHYVEPLVGPDSVSTLPPETYAAVRALPRVERTVDRDPAETARDLTALAAAGVDLDAVCAALEPAGVTLFADAWVKLAATLESKQQSLSSG